MVAVEGVGMEGLGREIDAAHGLGPQLADQEDPPATDPWRDADLLVETGKQLQLEIILCTLYLFEFL